MQGRGVVLDIDISDDVAVLRRRARIVGIREERGLDEARFGILVRYASDARIESRRRIVGVVLHDAERLGGGFVAVLQVRKHGHEDKREHDYESERPDHEHFVPQHSYDLVFECRQHRCLLRLVTQGAAGDLEEHVVQRGRLGCHASVRRIGIGQHGQDVDEVMGVRARHLRASRLRS